MPMVLTIALLGAIALLVPALHSLLMSRRDLALAQTALVDRQLLESAAGDLVLSIEEDVAAMNARFPDRDVTARDKSMRFIERGRHELPVELTDDELLALLQSTLPKLGLGSFADRRPRMLELGATIEKTVDRPLLPQLIAEMRDNRQGHSAEFARQIVDVARSYAG